jgi:lipopolysaccharide transport protein LptA
MHAVLPLSRTTVIARSSLLALLMSLSGAQSGWAGPLDFSSDDTVTITADRAWEAEEPNVIHFSGSFELHAPDWSMSGDTAVVYGKLDDPDRVIVEGKPATVSFLRESEDDAGDADADERVDGEASVVEYFRSTDKLIMKGSSRLVREDSNLTSEIIEYDVDTDRYSAGGEGGINIEYTPEDD